MRGLIFNYLLEYLEETHEYVADGGLYPDKELLRLVRKASEKLHMEQAAFLEGFGEWIFVPLYAKLSTFYNPEEPVIEYGYRCRLHYLAKGIFSDCAKHFNERLYVVMQPSAIDSVAKFTIRRTA